MEARCTGLTRRQDEQELKMGIKEKEIERLVNQECELRRELRNWQQRVFQLESEVCIAYQRCGLTDCVGEKVVKCSLLRPHKLKQQSKYGLTPPNFYHRLFEEVYKLKPYPHTHTLQRARKSKSRNVPLYMGKNMIGCQRKH